MVAKVSPAWGRATPTASMAARTRRGGPPPGRAHFRHHAGALPLRLGPRPDPLSGPGPGSAVGAEPADVLAVEPAPGHGGVVAAGPEGQAQGGFAADRFEAQPGQR